MAGLTWSAGAREDLRSIRRLIAQNSKRGAVRVASEITASVRRLRTFPESGRVVPDFDNPAYREVIAGRYRVIYRYLHSEDVVEIIMVVDGSRMLPPLSGAE